MAKRDAAARLLLVTAGGVQQVATDFSGIDLVQEVARMLGSEHIVSTKLGEDLVLWCAGDEPGQVRQANPVAGRLAAEYGLPAVTGVAVISGPMPYGSPYPLDADVAERVVARLGA